MKNKITIMCVLAAVAVGSVTAIEVKVDFEHELGKIKPVHSVGQGPLLGWCDFTMFKYLKEANIPFARLHDVGGPFGKGLYVDIPNLFRDFDADENDQKSYDFLYTDMYLKALIDNGVEPYFRLGVTIENSVRQTKRAFRITPPKDFAKWARICEHVIRHYTEGWADGYHWKITYWEIWNEADDFIDYRNAMWAGTWQQYCEMYDITAKHLKAKFPHLKIGGYGKCTLVNVIDAAEGRETKEEELYRDRCFHEFCDYIKEHDTPLDFFSWHGYMKPCHIQRCVDYIRKGLERVGRFNVEQHLGEWLTGDRSGEFWNKPELAAIIAEFVIAAQQSEGLYMANIYDAKCSLGKYAPLFNPLINRPGKAFYALKDFGRLYRLGTEVKCEIAEGKDRIRAVAAKGANNEAAVMIVNNTDSDEKVTWNFDGKKPIYCLITDNYRSDTLTELPDELPRRSFALVVFN